MSEFYCIACEKVFTDSTIHLCPHKKDWGADKDSNPLKEYNETLESIYNCMEEKEPIPTMGITAKMMENKMPKCKGCGKEIFFAKHILGEGKFKNVPLDPLPVIFEVTIDDAVGPVQCKPVQRGRFMVSHFNTCPNANDFSSSNRKKEDSK